MFDYSYSSMTLRDAYELDKTLLDGFVLNTTEQTERFKAIFHAKYDIYDIGGETIEQFRIFINNRFNAFKDYYQQLIDIYYQEINYLDGIKQTVTYSETSQGENRDIDLPNKSSTGEYVSNKTIGETSKSYTRQITGGEDVVDMRNKYLQYIRNLYSDFADEFKDCFSLIYG